jgi:hypothetical protein
MSKGLFEESVSVILFFQQSVAASEEGVFKKMLFRIKTIFMQQRLNRQAKSSAGDDVH